MSIRRRKKARLKILKKLKKESTGAPKFNIRKLIRGGLYLFFSTFLFISILFAWYSKDLPNPYKFSSRKIAQSTKILDRSGKLLYEIHGEKKRTLIEFSEMPEWIKWATIACEDADFYKHKGFDLKGIFRALLYNLTHRESLQGGSTITQQLIKNAILKPKRTLSRKIQELILAIEIERIYSKNEILKMYLNEIPFGNNAYGIQAAAETYFGKDAKDLTLAESALLAAIPRAPTYYSPYGPHRKELFKRKDYILDRMAELGFISEEEAEKAKKEEIKFKEKREDILAPHFVMYVKEILAEKFGEKMLTEGGLIVTTSLDLELQKLAEKIVKEQAKKNLEKGAKNAALVAIDPKTGEILAMVGSVDYFDIENEGNVNVCLSLRQPGSAIKPIVYAAAFKQGFTPATMLLDVKTNFGTGYIPENYDKKEHGIVTMRKALGNSLNIPAVKTLFLVGVENACDLAKQLGISSLNEPWRYGLSLVLGGGEVRLLELTAAYGVFANQGRKVELTPILKVETKDGELLFEAEPEIEEVLDPQIAYLITNILADDSAREITFGRGSILNLKDRPAAVKTGTTDEYRDAWTIGYTPSLVVGVWVGNNDGSPMNKAAGAMVAAPIWHRFMEEALKNTPVEEFPVPSGIQKIVVDELTGKLPLDDIPENLKEELKTREEIFTSWAPQIEKDNVHKILKVIPMKKLYPDLEEEEYKLAGENCPKALVEEKVFLEVHSIRPDLPNWEGPVLEWAKAQGYNNLPTEEFDCSEFLEENQPELEIISPEPNSKITGTLEIKIKFKAPLGVNKVEYFIDEEKFAENLLSPFDLSWDILDAAKGTHEIKVKLTDKLGLTAEDKIKLTLFPDPEKPEIILSKIDENKTQVLFEAKTSAPKGAEIEKVIFYVNAKKEAEVLISSGEGRYLYTWQKPKEEGTYVFYAEAHTNTGKKKRSNLVYYRIKKEEEKEENE